MLVARKQTLHKHFCVSQNATMKTRLHRFILGIRAAGLALLEGGRNRHKLWEEAGADMPWEYKEGVRAKSPNITANSFKFVYTPWKSGSVNKKVKHLELAFSKLF